MNQDKISTNGHFLRAVTEWLPGKEPSDYDLETDATSGYWTRYYRCEYCGQERNRESEFREACAEQPSSLLSDGGYSVEDPRTRRALTEEMTVEFGHQGSEYRVLSQSGNTYTVDVSEGTCTCPDYEQRSEELDGKGCKHVRRVVFSIRSRVVPEPNGTFSR